MVTGAANGLFSTSNRILLQRTIPEPVHGRAFGLVDSLDSWGFALAVLAGGALTTALGGRATFAIAGAALVLVAATNLKGQTLRPCSRAASERPRDGVPKEPKGSDPLSGL